MLQKYRTTQCLFPVVASTFVWLLYNLKFVLHDQISRLWTNAGKGGRSHSWDWGPPLLLQRHYKFWCTCSKVNHDKAYHEYPGLAFVATFFTSCRQMCHPAIGKILLLTDKEVTNCWEVTYFKCTFQLHMVSFDHVPVYGGQSRLTLGRYCRTNISAPWHRYIFYCGCYMLCTTKL